MSEICDEAKGMVHWFGVPNNDWFPSVKYIGGFDMGETGESFDSAWDKNLKPLLDNYVMVLREDQAQGLAIDLLDEIEALTKRNVQRETE